VKISGENSMTLSSKEPVPVEMPYVRCQLWSPQRRLRRLRAGTL